MAPQRGGSLAQSSQLQTVRRQALARFVGRTSRSAQLTSRRACAGEQPVPADGLAAELPQQQHEEIWEYAAPEHVIQRNQQYVDHGMSIADRGAITDLAAQARLRFSDR